jgi:hypothetical protein
MKAIHETGFKGYVAQEFILKIWTSLNPWKGNCNLWYLTIIKIELMIKKKNF